MKKILTFLAKKLWPDFETLAEPDRISLLGQLFGTLYNLPLVVVSLGWLLASGSGKRCRAQEKNPGEQEGRGLFFQEILQITHR